MRFAVVGDSREWSEPGSQFFGQRENIHPVAVEAEARRRKGMAKLDEWQMREFVTGSPIPDNVREVCRQIDFAAEALRRMSPIPADYAEDIYWPRIW